ncbi:endonuclease [Microbacterium faecale]|uniref:Endonuclease n=1 Tax=Microbacterium faecale TaxID=1804630 RepID=A0A917DGJ4_9MICO|nr:endonuclease/exonuclease/phosphatase family protein [Microbacterium faecale]GGD36453.1 endonuclease [Microbacterium faecale]
MLRSLGVLVTVLFACAAAVVTWPGFFRLEDKVPFAQIVAVRGATVVVFAILTVLFLCFAASRRLRGFAVSMAVVSAVAAIAGGVTLGLRGYGAATMPDKEESSVRVMTWNTLGNATGAETIARTAVAMEADIVALPETAKGVGEEVAVLMRDLGSPMWVHSEIYNEDVERGPQAWQTTLLVSPGLGDYSVIDASQDGTTMLPSAVAMPLNDGSGPIIVAAHAVAPQARYMAEWRSDLRWLADQCVDDNVIMVGDFNATVDHMAALGEGGNDLGWCRDAAAESGNGAVGTWPTWLPSTLGTPIDHVLVSDAWEVSGSIVVTNVDDAGSDHRPLVVQLEPAD